MHEPKRYARSPITEALIDLRVELPGDTNLEALGSVQTPEEDRYPARSDRVRVHSQVTVGTELAAAAQATPIGFAFTSEDERQVFQARFDGFTFHRLRPYDRWQPFRDEARRLWDVYRTSLCPTAVTRLSVRYINRLDLPRPLTDLSLYLRTLPEIAPELPQGLAGYLMQLQIPQGDDGTMLVLNQALVPPPRPSVVSVLLDLELFRETPGLWQEEQLWQAIEVLHERADTVFEVCITERAKSEVIS